MPSRRESKESPGPPLESRLSEEQMARLESEQGGVTISFRGGGLVSFNPAEAFLSSLPARLTVEPVSMSDVIGSVGLPDYDFGTSSDSDSTAATVPPRAEPDQRRIELWSGAATTPPRPAGGSEGATGSSLEGSDLTTAQRGLDFSNPAAAQPEFVMRRCVGEGGMGEVWEAWQASLDRTVAVKRLKKGDMVEFLQEAYVSAELDHPNIVPVYDLGRVASDNPDGTAAPMSPLLAMKLVEGRSWSQLLADERPEHVLFDDDFLARHLRILIDVCNAVAYAHSRAIIHRDLKPAQVMIGEFGEVFLMDWGLAMSLRDAAPKTINGAMPKYPTRADANNLCGSPAFMAPEQTDSDTARLSERTDVYLLGAILFMIVSGRPPHHAKSAKAALFKALLNDCVELPEETPADLRTLIGWAMATQPDDRPATAIEFRDALEDYLSGATARREADAIIRGVQKELSGGASGSDYAGLADLSRRLHRARQLAPRHRSIDEAEREVTLRHARLALQEGDLRLAESLSATLPAEDAAAGEIAEEISRVRAAQTRRESERRLLGIAAVVLLLVVGAVAWRARESSLAARESSMQAESAQMKERAAVAEAMLATERANEQERLTALLEDINDLRRAENELAERITMRYSLPESFENYQDRRAQIRIEQSDDKRMALMAECEALAAARAELMQRLPPSVEFEPPPATLLMAEALVELYDPEFERIAHRTYGKFTDAAALMETAPEPMIGAGVSAQMAGYSTSAGLALEDAIARSTALRGESAPTTLQSLRLAAEAQEAIGDESASYIALQDRSIEHVEAQFISTAIRLATLHHELGRHEKAMSITSNTLALTEGDPPPSASELNALKRRQLIIGLRTQRALFLQVEGRWEEMLEMFTEVEQDRRELAQHPRYDNVLSRKEILELVYQRAQALYQLGRADEAIALLETEARELAEQVASESGDLNSYYSWLGSATLALTDPDAAIVHLENHLERVLERWGPDHPVSAIAMQDLARALQSAGRILEALEYYERAVAIAKDRFGLTRQPTLMAQLNLAHLHQSREDTESAMEVYAEVLPNIRGTELEGGVMDIFSRNNFAMLLVASGNYDAADRELRIALAGIRRMFGDAHPHTATVVKNLSEIALVRERYEESWRMIMLYQAMLDELVDDDHPDRLQHLQSVTQMLVTEGNAADGLRLTRYAIARSIDILGPDHPFLYGLQRILLSSIASTPVVDAERELIEILAIVRHNEAQQAVVTQDFQVIAIRASVIVQARGLARRLVAIGEEMSPRAAYAIGLEAMMVEMINLPADAPERDGWIDQQAARLGLEGLVQRAREAGREAAVSLRSTSGNSFDRAGVLALQERVLGEKPAIELAGVESWTIADSASPDTEAEREWVDALLERLATEHPAYTLDEVTEMAAPEVAP